MENRVCVKCDSVLDKGTYAGVEVDLCPNCGGLWLDKGELDKIEKGTEEQVDTLRKSLGGTGKSTPSEIQTACVACDGTLKEVELGEVTVDYCTKCGGMFLDRGELD